MPRTLKLTQNFVPQASNQSTGFAIRPKITLTGKWLEEAGFLPSEFVNVEVQFGKMIITCKE
jgi:hypothetical protein